MKARKHEIKFSEHKSMVQRHSLIGNYAMNAFIKKLLKARKFYI